MKITPWPHSPAIIARVEVYAANPNSFPKPINAYYEAQLNGAALDYRWNFDDAVARGAEMVRDQQEPTG